MTALLVGGKGKYAQLDDAEITAALGGYFANYKERISVPFPGDAPFEVSVPVGSDNLYNAIYSHQATKGNPLTIGGVSKGSASVVNVLYRLMEDYENTTDGRTPPSGDSMTVVLYGSPGPRYFLTVRHEKVPETPWDTVVVSAEYDGIADMPDNMFNVLAVLNALKGAELLHVDAAFYDLKTNPVMYREVVSKEYGSTTTYVVIPAERLPLLHDMYEAGTNPGYVRLLEKILRPIIDSAYKRNWASQRGEWKKGIVNMPAPPTGPSTPGGPAPLKALEKPGNGGGTEPEPSGLLKESGEEAPLVQASLEPEDQGQHRRELLAPEDEELDVEQILNEEEANKDEGNEKSESAEMSQANDSENEEADAPESQAPESPADAPGVGSEAAE